MLSFLMLSFDVIIWCYYLFNVIIFYVIIWCYHFMLSFGVIIYFMYRRPTLCTLHIAVNFLKSLKIAVVWGEGGATGI